MPELAFFIGKGGVGKTTVAAAYAVLTAAGAKNRVLLVSTDPAHSLGDVLQQKLGKRIKSLAVGPGKLAAWELDSSILFGEFIHNYKSEILKIIERGSLFTAPEIAPLLDSALPGMAEMAALLAIRDSMESGKYTHIVVDTAPLGHTLRLFNLPEQFARLVKFLRIAASRDRVLAEHFGGARSAQPPLIQQWQEQLRELTRGFSAAHIFLATTAEKFALNESVRCVAELRRSNPSFHLQGVVLNRVVRRAGRCASCRARMAAATQARQFLLNHFPSATVLVGDDPGFPIAGTSALLAFGHHVFNRKPLTVKPKLPKHKPPKLAMVRVKWPTLNSSLSFVIGKGGVGKTTVSAALAFHARRTSGAPVVICSVDPAPSLDDVFQTRIGDDPVAVLSDADLRASELDSVALFRKWIVEIGNEVDSATTSEVSGIHLDLSFERQLLSALLDIVPPGLDEVLAILRISDLCAHSSAKVVIDMAPTGHALELLRMPDRIVSWCRVLLKSLAAHRKLALVRNAAARIAELEVRARALSRMLGSPNDVRVFSVMLPEPLPDHETKRLLLELDQLRLRPGALFVNRVLREADGGSCARCRAARVWQVSVLDELKHWTSARDVFVIRNFPQEIAGEKGLRAITRELWRLN